MATYTGRRRTGMAIARGVGPSERVAIYKVPDGEMAAGSTLGGPKVCMVIKPTGAIEKVYSIDAGKTLLGTLVLHHWDELTGMHLSPHSGTFTIHPEHQEHDFALSNDVHVHEDIFVLSSGPQHGDEVDPPAVYYTVQLRNDADEERRIATYAFCELRGEMSPDIVATYDTGLGAPNPYVNRGVLWAKANMLRVETKAPTGWCFTNDPTRSSKAVGRDTAWFAYGADYLTPEFAREALLAFVRRQQPNGLIVESYDIR